MIIRFTEQSCDFDPKQQKRRSNGCIRQDKFCFPNAMRGLHSAEYGSR